MRKDARSAAHGRWRALLHLVLVSASRPPDSAERFAQQLLGAAALQGFVREQLLEDDTHLAFAEAEVAEGGENLGVDVDRTRLHGLAVRGAVRVAKVKPAITSPLDAEVAAMVGAMVGITESDEICGDVATALRTWDDVVDVDEA